jgi:uncharacterized protein (TIGR03000 family)
MFRSWRTALVLPAVVAVLVWTVTPLLARGPHGAHAGGGFHSHPSTVHAIHASSFHGHPTVVHAGHVSGFHAGHVGAFHTAHVGSFHGGHFGGWHGDHFGRWHHGWGWGFGGLGYYGAYPYFDGGYPYAYGGYPSSYGSYPYNVPDYSYLDAQPYVPPPPDYSDYYGTPGYGDTTPRPSVPPAMDRVPQATTDTTAHIDVMVPDSAEVWVEGVKTQQTGSLRHFVSPPLTPGREFSYDIRAKWTDKDGKVVDRTRPVQVHAGGQTMVNFTAPAAGE